MLDVSSDVIHFITKSKR